jgi:hypothetical protein
MRRRRGRLVPAIALALAVLAGTSAAGEEGGGAEFVLRVGKSEHPVTPGEAFVLPTAKGERIESSLRVADVPYIGYGFRFLYPGTMELDVAPEGAGATIHLSHGLDYFAVIRNLPKGEGSPEEARAELAVVTRRWLERQGGKPGLEAACTREIAGEAREGTRFVSVGDEDPTIREVTAFEFNGRVRAFAFVWRESTARAAGEAFRKLATSLRVPEPGEEKERAPRRGYVLDVGGREHYVTLAEPFLVVTPKGDSFLAVLLRAPVAFSDFGIRFSHPADMEVETESPPGRDMVHASRGSDFSAAIQVFVEGSDALKPSDVEALTVRFVKASVESAGVRFESEGVGSRTLAGKKRVGTLLTTGGPDPMRVEIYAFVLGKRMVTVCLTWREAAKNEADRAFRMIGETLREE